MRARRTLVGRSRHGISPLARWAAAIGLLTVPIAMAIGSPPRAPVHSSPSETPKIDTFGEGFPIRVHSATGPVWIDQVNRCDDGGDPYPKCLACHCDIENATVNMFEFDLDCTFCHGGDPDATTIEDAHVHPNGRVRYDATVPPLDDDLAYQQFVNPSNLRVAGESCGICHHTKVSDLPKSMMATAAGHYAGGLFQNGVVDTKTPVYGTFAITDDDGYVPVEQGAVESLLDLLTYAGGDPSQFATHFAAVPSQACARCHLWSRGKGYRGALGQDGVYRADGCAACHMLYDNDGLSRSADPSIDHVETGHPRQHVLTRQVPTDQCLHCHHRGARIGLNYTGRAQMPPRLPSGPGVPGTTDERFNGNFHYVVPDTNPQDIHAELGMHCIDCHVGSEVMGDGNIYGHMDQATKIECRTCHGMPDEYPTLADNDGAVLRNVALERLGDPKGDELAREALVLTSKVTGRKHEVPVVMEVATSQSNPYAACAMNGDHLKADGGLECYACHSSWVPNCFGCHFERDERKAGLNLMTREYEVGRARTNNKVFETLRQFSIGPNSEGRVAPYLVACQPIADVTAPDGQKILDMVMPVTVNGLSGLAHNPVNPHTVRGPGDVRSCAECHRSPPSLGFGSGNYTIARDHLYAAGGGGVASYDFKTDPSEPGLVGSLPGAGGAKAIASLPNGVEGTVDYLYVARGVNGVAIYDRRPGAPTEPVHVIDDVDAIDVSRAARFLYVVEQGVGVRIYDNGDPETATPVATIPIPTAVRAVPWGIHLLVAAGPQGLFIVDIADHRAPFVAGTVPGMIAMDVLAYAHYQPGSAFAVRAYVADPGYGVRIVDMLPDYESAQLVGGLPLVGAAGLDAYTRYVLATENEPSREHDYLYVAAGGAGLYVFDMTAPDDVFEVAALTELGGEVVDVDVASRLAPPGTDDYAILANRTLGLQVVDVNDPHVPVVFGTVPDSTPVDRVLVEVQAMDRYLDEQGRTLKENSHPNTGTFTRADIVRILSASIDCGGTGPASDIDGDGDVDTDDLLILIDEWGPCPPPPNGCPCDLDEDGAVGFSDLLRLLAGWS